MEITLMQNNPLREHELMLTRRQLFGRSVLGLGTAALANLLGPELLAAGDRVEVVTLVGGG